MSNDSTDTDISRRQMFGVVGKAAAAATITPVVQTAIVSCAMAADEAPLTEQYGSPLGPGNMTRPVPKIEIPSFRALGDDPSSWIKQADTALRFRTQGQKKDVTLVPLNSLMDKRYSVYWHVS